MQQQFLMHWTSAKIIDIPTEDDEVDEVDSKVIVALLADDNIPVTYTISSELDKKSTEVEVTDNDEPTLPIVTLSASAISVTEGDTVRFTLTSDQVAGTDGIMVSYLKSQTGDFFTSSFSGSSSVKIWPGGTSEDFSHATHDDDVEESDGSFTIALEAGTSYTLGS